jgi:hypothetical protein
VSEGLYNPVSAARAAHARTRKGLMIAIGVSIFVHGAGVAWALSSSTPAPKREVQSAIPVQLVKLGKKRDPNMLPRLAAEPPPPAPEAVKLDTGKAPAASSAPRDRSKKTDDKLSDAARRLLERDSALDRALERVEEPEGDPDGDAAGTTTDNTNAARGYEAQVARALKAKYSIPEAIPAGQRQFLRARVVLYLDASGLVSRFEFLEQHPNRLFMGALETMLMSSLRLPPPPASEAARYASDGLEVAFSP